MRSDEIKALDARYIMQTYARYPIALVRGRGTLAWDAEGKEYLDFLGGIAVNVLGHCHPAVVTAISQQAATLIHCSNLYYTQPGAELAQELAELTGLQRSFFCNSGAEANEGAIKLARKYQWRKGQERRRRILSATHSFHGRTLAALTATAKPEIQEGFGPLPDGFSHVEWNDPGALAAAMDETVAAVIIEPVQGEGGIHPADPAYLQAARDLCTRHGALLILDEIQSGMGRTGHFLACQGYGVRPDIVTLAKGLGGGLPIGAILATEEAAAGFGHGDHGSTFGANPVACAAALAVVRTIRQQGLTARSRELGAYLAAQLRALREVYPPAVQEVRGMGLMQAIDLAIDARAVLAVCHQEGLLANVTAGNVLRLLPPLTVSREEIDRAVTIIGKAIAAVAQTAAD